jgi:hypothetical protein
VPVTDLKTNYAPEKAHMVSGKTLNQMAKGINAATGGRGQIGINTVSKIDVVPDEFIFGVGVVVGATDQCSYDDDENALDAPCWSVNKYLIRFRYFDETLGIWTTYPEDLRLDASVYYEPTDTLVSPPAIGAGYGDIPAYGYGDRVCGYFDPQRNWFVPISVPFADQPAAEFFVRPSGVGGMTVPVSGSNVTGSQTCYCYLEVARPNFDNDWRTVAIMALPLPQVAITGNYEESRATFASVACTSGSMIRLRVVRTSNHSNQPVTVKLVTAHVRLTGAGRRNPSTLPGGGVEQVSLPGGQAVSTFYPHASVTGRYKDSPIFGALTPQIIGVGYLDYTDQWMIDIEVWALFNIEPDDESTSSSRSSTSQSSQSSTSPSSLSSSSHSRSSSTESTSSLSSSSSHSRTSSSTSVSRSTSSSSQSISTSSSSGFDCIRFVCDVTFNEAACELTVSCAELCLPRGSGIRVKTADCDCPPYG